MRRLVGRLAEIALKGAAEGLQEHRGGQVWHKNQYSQCGPAAPIQGFRGPGNVNGSNESLHTSMCYTTNIRCT